MILSEKNVDVACVSMPSTWPTTSLEGAGKASSRIAVSSMFADDVALDFVYLWLWETGMLRSLERNV
jgi:hypothetical protein